MSSSLRREPTGGSRVLAPALAKRDADLAARAGVDHLLTELGIARQDAPVDRANGGGGPLIYRPILAA